jgi:hypothetical protein
MLLVEFTQLAVRGEVLSETQFCLEAEFDENSQASPRREPLSKYR